MIRLLLAVFISFASLSTFVLIHTLSHGLFLTRGLREMLFAGRPCFRGQSGTWRSGHAWCMCMMEVLVVAPFPLAPLSHTATFSLGTSVVIIIVVIVVVWLLWEVFESIDMVTAALTLSI